MKIVFTWLITWVGVISLYHKYEYTPGLNCMCITMLSYM